MSTEQPNVIGKREDGTLIGELAGKLYIGTKRMVGFDQIEREVEQTADGYELSFHVGDFYVGGETRTSEPEAYAPKKAYKDVEQEDGSMARREVTLPIIDWSPL